MRENRRACKQADAEAPAAESWREAAADLASALVVSVRVVCDGSREVAALRIDRDEVLASRWLVRDPAPSRLASQEAFPVRVWLQLPVMPPEPLLSLRVTSSGQKHGNIAGRGRLQAKSRHLQLMTIPAALNWRFRRLLHATQQPLNHGRHERFCHYSMLIV